MTSLEALQRAFIDQRNGIFIHFNSGTTQYHQSDIIDWDYGVTGKNDPRRHPFEPATWNPDRLDTAQWAAVAKSAGARFAALTTKHHEGFCLWPTQTTTHCVSSGQVTTDVVASYLKDFRAAGIEAGLYFSMLDLQHDITATHCTPADKAMIHAQLTELLTNYGDIPFLITDGWNAPWGGPSYQDLPFAEVDGWVKSLQPNCLLMNIGSVDDLSTTDILFFENAAGQETAASFAGPGIACNLFTTSWFWKDRYAMEPLKSVDWALGLAEQYNRQNVNFMLNINPDDHGQVAPNLAAQLAAYGQRYQQPAPLTALPAGWLWR
ncbi:alpha-L-fucosidase [Lacticaseibacillus mingshuiensis]|uniref:alpha-L-fucosidase n=1 Tax=Lacticaseibacillus mingshuiensis TaxID=2799574 RepID=A0ABW4CJ33_9LACO|nr:alpha-L-fucosidase [Lacticaseibacillus mingshuiensis]